MTAQRTTESVRDDDKTKGKIHNKFLGVGRASGDILAKFIE